MTFIILAIVGGHIKKKVSASRAPLACNRPVGVPREASASSWDVPREFSSGAPGAVIAFWYVRGCTLDLRSGRFTCSGAYKYYTFLVT